MFSNEFEMLFLLDLESGKLQVEPGDCGGLQGMLNTLECYFIVCRNHTFY